MKNRSIIAGSSLLALAVILGAFGAHALKGYLDPYGLSIWEKASFYHYVHALGLLLVGVFHELWPEKAKPLNLAAVLLVAGIALFSGSLYLLALSGAKWLGAITPLGGTAFILAWSYLAYTASRK